MATVALSTAFQGVPSYWASFARSVSQPGESFGVITAGAGTGGGSQSGGIFLGSASTGSNNWTIQDHVDIVFDLRDYQLLNITAATLQWSCAKLAIGTSGFFTTDAANGLAVVSQRESVRGLGTAVSNYQEISAGSGMEYASRVPWSSLPSSASTVTWTFNATGLAYLNSVKDKTYHQGYAFMGLVWGGHPDGDAPVSPGFTAIQRVDPGIPAGGSPMTLTLTYSTTAPNVGINVGDVQKAVSAAYINVSNAWRQVSNIQINIGDTWRTIA